MIKRATLWPLGIVAFLGALMGLYAYLFHVAGDPSALVVEPDYYQKGLHYDDEMAQQRRNAELGWTIEPTVNALAAGGAELQVALKDAGGRPLDGASVRVVAVSNLLADHPDSTALAGHGGGEYDARLSLPRAGMWELRFRVVRGDVTFTADERIELPQAIALR